MRTKSINGRMDTCTDCGFTALFMYVDAAGFPLCPKCQVDDIKAFKELLSELDDDLESESGTIDNEELTELNF